MKIILFRTFLPLIGGLWFTTITYGQDPNVGLYQKVADDADTVTYELIWSAYIPEADDEVPLEGDLWYPHDEGGGSGEIGNGGGMCPPYCDHLQAVKDEVKFTSDDDGNDDGEEEDSELPPALLNGGGGDGGGSGGSSGGGDSIVLPVMTVIGNSGISFGAALLRFHLFDGILIRFVDNMAPVVLENNPNNTETGANCDSLLEIRQNYANQEVDSIELKISLTLSRAQGNSTSSNTQMVNARHGLLDR